MPRLILMQADLLGFGTNPDHAQEAVSKRKRQPPVFHFFEELTFGVSPIFGSLCGAYSDS